MKKTLAVLGATVIFGLGNVMAIPTVKADTNFQQKISEANLSVAKAQDGLNGVTDQINRLDQAITENNNKIKDTENRIAETNAQVSELQVQITSLNDRIQKRSEVLKKRAVTYQETGGNVSYLDVLLGASSFRDLVDRANAVATLVASDSDLLNQQQADKEAVEEKQNAVKTELTALNTMKTEQVGMLADLADQKAQSEAMKAQLQQTANDGMQKIASLRAEEQKAAAAALENGSSEVKQANKGNQTASTSNSSRVSSLTSGPAAPQSTGDMSTVIRAGYKYIGNSVYVFGGGRTASDVANGYFDCSGFVHWAFAQAGISVGSSTDSLLGAGSRVSFSEIQPGDLVFFNTYKTNGHVGIYIGGGSFIGSQSSTGVAVANMSGGYWAQHFAGVVVRVR